ncbi:MAG: PBP1A family penicillin-binding protein [Chitinophagales bacterium]
MREWFRLDKTNETKAFWQIYSWTVMAVVLFFALIAIGVFGRLPSIDDLENPQTAVATEVISADGVVLGKYYQQNRSNIRYENLPKPLVNALLATEDIRFYDHTGVDLKAIARALSGVLGRDSKGGGSTITQQLAKNLFPRGNHWKITLALRKFKEWVIAAKLERAYTKEEIIAMYFNTVEFSDNAFGIKSASQTYFNKPVDSLKIEEAAVLVGMLKAPYQYNPRLHPVASQKRRNVVLDQMFHYKFITQQQRDSLFDLPIALQFTEETHDEGMAPYFREYLRLYLKDYFEKHPDADGNKYNLYTSGLKIYTTIDSRLQQYAEAAQQQHLTEWQQLFFKMKEGSDPWKDFATEWKATYESSSRYKQWKEEGKTAAQIDALMHKAIPMRIFSWQGERDTIMSPYDSLRYHRLFLQNGFIAVDPATGGVRAWVGGINYKYFQYDHVNVNTKRQIGSTFKPILYTAAVRDKGYSPCYQVPNLPVTFEKGDPRFGLISDWTPHNSDGKYGGMLTLKQALANSVNTVSAYLMHEMSVAEVKKLAQAMGIVSKIPDQPSICLGTADISLIEMAGAYTTFVNKGVHVSPVFISRIEDRSGNVIATFDAERNEVLDEQTAYTMIEMLRGVVQYGTSQRLRFRYNLRSDMAGKTGTTQNNSDGWFIGLTPDLVVATWVGCEDRFLRFRSMAQGQGASTALPIYGYFMQKVYADSALTGISPSAVFEKPEKMNIELNCGAYFEEKPDHSRDYGGSEDSFEEDTMNIE